VITALILALAVAAGAILIAVAEHQHAREEAAEHRKLERDLLNRLASRTLGEYVGVSSALDPPPQPPLPDGWHHDDTGLISEPYYRDAREA
jgi:hypothetical protein